MNTRRIFRPVALVMVLATLLFPVQSISAAGAQNIYGNAVTSNIHYYSPRYITDNSTPGPSVVFTQDYGPHNLRLGAWDCNNEFSYPWGGLTHQDHNVLRFVADGVPGQFCMVADVSSGSGGSWGGYLQWD